MRIKKIRTEAEPEAPASMENKDPEAEPEIIDEDEAEKDQPSMLHELYKDDPMAVSSGSGSRHLRCK